MIHLCWYPVRHCGKKWWYIIIYFQFSSLSDTPYFPTLIPIVPAFLFAPKLFETFFRIDRIRTRNPITLIYFDSHANRSAIRNACTHVRFESHMSRWSDVSYGKTAGAFKMYISAIFELIIRFTWNLKYNILKEWPP